MNLEYFSITCPIFYLSKLIYITLIFAFNHQGNKICVFDIPPPFSLVNAKDKTTKMSSSFRNFFKNITLLPLVC